MKTIRRPRSGALWTAKYGGGDQFAGAILDNASALDGVGVLCWAADEGYIEWWSGHDDDIVGWDPNDPEDYKRPDAPIHAHLAKIKKMIGKKLRMNIITCNLHGDPIFANGGFTNPNPAIRALAIQKALRAAWIGNFFGATGVTYWTARDGFEIPSAVNFDGIDLIGNDGPYAWLMFALDTISNACKISGYSIKRGTIEPKVNEPRGVIYLPLTGSALWLISTLDNPSFWGVNPEIPQHSAMACQSPLIEVLQAVYAKKLFFLHLGGQISGQFDNDFPPLFGTDNVKIIIQCFLYLQEVGWNDIVEFDCHAMRSDCAQGKEVSLQTRRAFFTICAQMYTLIEQIIVPRILQSEGLQKARKAIWAPEYLAETSGKIAASLVVPQTQDQVDALASIKVPVDLIQKTSANCSAAEVESTLAMFGVAPQQLDKALATVKPK